MIELIAPNGDAVDLDAYPVLLLDLKPTGVLLITINRPQRFNAVDDAMHAEMGKVWLTSPPPPRPLSRWSPALARRFRRAANWRWTARVRAATPRSADHAPTHATSS